MILFDQIVWLRQEKKKRYEEYMALAKIRDAASSRMDQIVREIQLLDLELQKMKRK